MAQQDHTGEWVYFPGDGDIALLSGFETETERRWFNATRGIPLRELDLSGPPHNRPWFKSVPLRNQALLCYRNAPLQALINTPRIREWLYRHNNPNESIGTQCAISSKDCMEGNETSLRELNAATYKLSERVAREQFAGGSLQTPEDAALFLFKVIETIHGQAMTGQGFSQDLIMGLLGLTLVKHFSCTLCGGYSHLEEGYDRFHLKAPSDLSSGRRTTEQRIDCYLTLAKRDLCWNPVCPGHGLGVYEHRTGRFRIRAAGSTLILHDGSIENKSDTIISGYLDLSRYHENEGTAGSLQYRLNAAVIHEDYHDVGHYTCYVRNVPWSDDGGLWFRMNDGQEPEPVAQDVVLNTNPTKDDIDKRRGPVLVFYNRIYASHVDPDMQGPLEIAVPEMQKETGESEVQQDEEEEGNEEEEEEETKPKPEGKKKAKHKSDKKQEEKEQGKPKQEKKKSKSKRKRSADETLDDGVQGKKKKKTGSKKDLKEATPEKSERKKKDTEPEPPIKEESTKKKKGKIKTKAEKEETLETQEKTKEKKKRKSRSAKK